MAHGAPIQSIRNHGITIEDGISGKRSTAWPQVVDNLDPNDAHDLIVVILPRHQISEVLPILAANGSTPNVMFFGNNAAGPGAMIDALGRERVLLGFPGAAAVAQGRILRYIICSKHEQPTTLGELDGATSPRIVEVASTLKSCGFPVFICKTMDAWLKTHVARILPTVCALYRAGGHPKHLAESGESLRLMVRGIREGYEVLRENGIPITPANHQLFERLPTMLLLPLMRRMLRAETAAIKVGHATAARAEWRCLANEFRTLIDRVEILTPAIEILNRHLEVEPGAKLTTEQPNERPIL